MNLRQFRVLSAVLRLSPQFTTPDLVREAGVSAEVVRKTYQRYESFFTVVADRKPKVRQLTQVGRDEITRELRQSRSNLPPPPAARGPEGEPLGLAAAEHILYELIPPVMDGMHRTVLLREALSHLALADQECELSNESVPSIPVEIRLDAVRRMLGFVETLHSAREALSRRVPKTDFSSVEVLATALINSAAAQKFSLQPTPRPVCAGLLVLKSIRTRAPEETDQIARALFGLAREPAWCKALGQRGVFWSSDEEALLEARLKDSSTILEPTNHEPFTIAVDRWEEAERSLPLRLTDGQCRIAFCDKVATRHLNPWSGSLHDSARLNAYPLALWLAQSWWRLRWEPAPWGKPTSSWSCAHALETIGRGWPSLILNSTGECIRGRCRPPRERDPHDPWYLETFDKSVLAKDFEHAVDRFVKKVLDRIAGSGQTELTVVWETLINERSNPALSKIRRLEAMLGFNPDEAPEQVIQDLNDLSTEAGPSAVDELAWACAGQQSPAVMLTETVEVARSSSGVQGKIVVPPSVLETVGEGTNGEPPWARGHRLARVYREHLGFGGSPISDDELAKTLGLAAPYMSDDAPTPAESPPLSLAIRNPEKRPDKFLFHSSRRYTRRFEAARFLGDAILARPNDHWLLCTRARTARQLSQRAFANEFLAPINSLSEFVQGDRSDERLEEAAVHFGLTSNTVRHHLELNAMELV